MKPMSAAAISVSDRAPLPLALGQHERGGLPWWTYFSPELLELEKTELFRKCWQLACHVSDVPEPGDYLCFDIVGERALVVRGKDGVVRAFHNVCRHRGSRVVADAQGQCRSALVCPFHGWSYNFDGTLKAVPQRRTLPDLDPVEHGLVPLDHEIWNGFVFVRFLASEQPPVARLLADYAADAAPYLLAEVRPLGGVETDELAVNWKAVRDVDNEGYHVAMAHPALHDLYGRQYADQRHRSGMARAFAEFNPGPGRLWSVRHYKKLLPEADHLPEDHRRAWWYMGLFPNTVLMFYPDCIGFYQEHPLAVDRTVQRIAYYGLPDERREMKLARYLSYRIDRSTGEEDKQLISWSWEAMQSSAFSGYILSDLEAGVRDYHDRLRQVIPAVSLEEEPSAGLLAEVNAALVEGRDRPAW